MKQKEIWAIATDIAQIPARRLLVDCGPQRAKFLELTTKVGEFVSTIPVTFSRVRPK
jgi:uncharacterized protein YjiK